MLRLTFRRKLFAAFTASLFTLALIAGLATLASLRSRLRQQIEDDFARAPELARRQLELTLNRFKAEVGIWAEDPRYASWLGRASGLDAPDGRPDPANVRAAHDGLGTLLLTSWQELKVTNDTGVLLLDEKDQDGMGDDLTSDALVGAALRGREVTRIQGRLLEMALPVTVEGTVRGVLIAGTLLEPMRLDLEQVLRARVAFAAQRGQAAQTSLVERDDETWLTATVPIAAPTSSAEVIGYATLERSLSAELAPQQRALALILGLATALGLSVAFGLALWLARSVAAPVVALSEATREIGRGNYDHRIEVRGADELGQLGVAFNKMAAGLKERVFFESALRRYLSPAVVEQLVSDPSRLRLGGERRDITVLFFDVAGFTSLSETLLPEQLVALANGYLDPLVAAIFSHRGTFDKFIGDAVMAFWGAPLAEPEHATLACRAALEMQRAMRQFALAQTDPRTRSLYGRIGINTGPAALGNLGSSQIMNYTAMGDAVNVAARLESMNKVYGTSVLVSETTARAAPTVPSREIDLVRVVGRGAPLRIYELLPEPPPPPQALAHYAEGLGFLRAKSFAAAERSFDQASQAGDGPCAAVLSARAAQFRVQPPPADWDGAFNAEHK